MPKACPYVARMVGLQDLNLAGDVAVRCLDIHSKTDYGCNYCTKLI